jgi:hypothetical protein
MEVFAVGKFLLKVPVALNLIHGGIAAHLI